MANNSSISIPKHYGLCKGGWYVDGETRGVLCVLTATVNIGESLFIVNTTSSLTVGQLIAFETNDGYVRAAKVKEIISSTVFTTYSKIEAAINNSTTIFSFYNNSMHPDYSGYKAIADYALLFLDDTQRSVDTLELFVKDIYDNYTCTSVGNSSFSNYTNTDINHPGSSINSSLKIITTGPYQGVKINMGFISSGDYSIRVCVSSTAGNLNISTDDSNENVNCIGDNQIIVHNVTKTVSGDLEITFKWQNVTTAFIGYIELLKVGEIDSVTGGNHVLFGDSWANDDTIFARLQSNFTADNWYKEGNGGDTIIDLLARFNTDVLPHSPDYVWIIVGTNDINDLMNSTVHNVLISQLTAMIQAAGAKPIYFDCSIGAPIAAGYDDYQLTNLSIEFIYTVNYYEYARAGMSAFKFKVKTDNDGTSNDDEFTLPLRSGSSYNFTISGAFIGSPLTVTNDSSPTLVFPGGAGTYELEIVENAIGGFPAIYFNNTGDKLKMLEITQLGSNKWLILEKAFRGCSNMTISATDNDDTETSDVTNWEQLFMSCTNVTSFPFRNTDSATSWQFMCRDSGITEMPDNLNTPNLHQVDSCWYRCPIVIIPKYDFSHVVSAGYMCYQCDSLTHFLVTDMRLCTNIVGAFSGVNNLAVFALKRLDSIDDFTGTFTSVVLPTVNYTNLLVGLALYNTNTSVVLNVNSSKYYTRAVDDRAVLTVTRSWNITDGGLSSDLEPMIRSVNSLKIGVGVGL